MTQQNPEWKESRDERMWETEQKKARRSFVQKEEKKTWRALSIGLMVLYAAFFVLLLFTIYLTYSNVLKLAATLEAPVGSPQRNDAIWYGWNVFFWASWVAYLTWKLIRLARKNKQKRETI